MYYPEPISKLITELNRLPGVGPKTAQRLAFHLLNLSEDEVRRLAAAMVTAKEKIRPCSVCGVATDQDPCRICRDPSRDQGLICVVEQPRDVVAMERAREFKGRYHVLGGVISPMDGIGPDQLRVRELLETVASGVVREVVVATNPDVEGEATATYLARLLKPLGVAVSRIAHGVPVGSDLEYADEATLARALVGRRPMD